MKESKVLERRIRTHLQNECTLLKSTSEMEDGVIPMSTAYLKHTFTFAHKPMKVLARVTIVKYIHVTTLQVKAYTLRGNIKYHVTSLYLDFSNVASALIFLKQNKEQLFLIDGKSVWY